MILRTKVQACRGRGPSCTTVPQEPTGGIQGLDASSKHLSLAIPLHRVLYFSAEEKGVALARQLMSASLKFLVRMRESGWSQGEHGIR